MNNRLLYVLVLACLFLTIGNLLRTSGKGSAETCEERPRLFSADANGDGGLDVADAVTILNFLFSGGPEPVCLAQEGSISGLTPEQAEILSHMSIEDIPVDDAGGTAKTLVISGINVQVVNGLGRTASRNGLGNLYLGYNELRNPDEANGENFRTGSHSLVVGRLHSFSGYGHIIGGLRNTCTGDFSNVTGGSSNQAAGEGASVAGGTGNWAAGFRSAVSGGAGNTAGDREDPGSTAARDRPGEVAVVSGGQDNVAWGKLSSVSAGLRNVAGDESDETGEAGRFASVSGGVDNTASGAFSSVSGGQNNTAAANSSTVSGGDANSADAVLSTVSGSCNQIADVSCEHVP